MSVLPPIEPLYVDLEVEGLPPIRARALTRGEMVQFIADASPELQTEIATAALGGTDEARQWYLDLPNVLSLRLFDALLAASSGASSEVARAGES